MAHHLCFISYVFPPLQAGGSVRSKTFAKYLARHDWIPHILTVQQPAHDSNKDHQLREEIGLSEAATLHRTFSLDPFRGSRGVTQQSRETQTQRIMRWIISFTLVPDRQILWLPFAIMEGLRVIKRYQCEAVYSTFGPPSNHLVALALKWITRKPWIADFRDPWTRNRNFIFPTRFHKWMHQKMERCVIHFADKVIAVNEPILEGFRRDYPEIHRNKFVVLPHCFDRELIEKCKCSSPKRDRFTLCYAGSFFKGRSPDPILRSVERALREEPETRKHLKLRLISGLKISLDENSLLRGRVELQDFCSHEEAIRQMCESDVLLAIVEEELKGQILNVKLFDYMGVGKPILALIPAESTSAEYLRPSGLATIVSPDDEEAIVGAIKKLYRNWEQNHAALPNEAYIWQFEASQKVGVLAGLLESLTQ